MHLDSHGITGLDGALDGSRAGASIATQVVAGYIVDRAVARRETSALSAVHSLLVKDSFNRRCKGGLIRS